MKLARTLLKHHDAFGRRSRPNLSVSGSDRNQGNIERIHANVTRVLLEHGADADVNVQDIFGLTPLGRARRARFSDIIQLLLSNNPT